MPALKAARDTSRDCGFDGVLVAEFKTPTGIDMRRKSLICMMGCSRAIFELSEPSGHLVEFDRIVEFGIRDVLVVYTPFDEETRIRISSLTKSWFGTLGIEPRPYTSVPQLRDIVRGWLPCGEDISRERPLEARIAVLADRLAEQLRHGVRGGVSDLLSDEFLDTIDDS